jgi:transposase
VVEHRTVFRRCSCGTVTRAVGPAGVSAPVQYGPHAAAIAVYLCLGQHLPVERTAGLLAEVFGTPMSTGTVAAWTVRASAGLAPFTAAAVAALAAAEVVHGVDRAAGGRPAALAARGDPPSTRFTGLFCHRKRGREAIDAAGVLPPFTGIAVHDAFAPYAGYRSATHALCNAHLLRELIAVVDTSTAHPRADADTPAGWCWAGQVIDALLALKAITDTGALPDPAALAAHRRLIVSAALIGAAADTSPPGAIGRRHRALPAASPGAARTTCASPPTRGCPSTPTRPSGTSGWSRSSRRCPGACAPSPAPRTSPRCAPTCQPRPSTAADPSTSSPNSPAATSGSPRQAE